MITELKNRQDAHAEIVFDRIREKYGEPTFEMFATMCDDLRDICEATIYLETQGLTELDDIARGHLRHMVAIFDACAEKFIDCDPYYRR